MVCWMKLLLLFIVFWLFGGYEILVCCVHDSDVEGIQQFEQQLMQ
jgi:hypothetical protein